MENRILVVDDEPDLAELVAFNLKQAGHEPIVVEDAQSALTEIRRKKPDLVILDLMLPDLSGVEVCRRIRREDATRDLPILMLTAKGEEIDRIVGFEVGADDYMVKPFSPRELVLRVGAILRRSALPPAKEEAQEIFEAAGLRVDVPRHRVTYLDAEIVLTTLEFNLLLDLASRKGRVQSRDALLERVWGYGPGVETRTVDTHVKRLREKLGAAAHVVETVRGVGYRFRDDIASA